VPGWECIDWDEEHGVGARSGGHALGQAMDFCNIGCPPVGTIRALTQGSILGKFPYVGVEGIAMECHVGATVGSMVTWRLVQQLCGTHVVGHAWLGLVSGADIAGGHCDVIRVVRDEVWPIRWHERLLHGTMVVVAGTKMCSSGIRCGTG